MHKWIKLQCQSKAKFNRYMERADIFPFINGASGYTGTPEYSTTKNSLQLGHIINNTMQYKMLMDSKKMTCPKMTIYIKWKPPDIGLFKLNVDGSCTDNPGKGDIGGVFRNSDSNFILGFNISVPHATISTWKA